jgi:2-C-methyl-D-erythritol 4-phosphate cytidylyltransferase / 2-C-methyl-D-erythritol 2,4-cyclodiphosphate synthase
MRRSPTVALILAAGRGTRAAAAGASPKQYAMLGHRTLLATALDPFLSNDAIDRIVVVIHPGDRAAYDNAIAVHAAHPKLMGPVFGGHSRQHSVRLGLEALVSLTPGRVLIHDAARPFVSAEIVRNVLAALDEGASNAVSGAIAAVPLADTLKRADAVQNITGTLSRDGLWRAQTPQAFRFPDILAAHRAAGEAGRDDFTDDAAVAEWRGLDVRLIEGDDRNAKITTAVDLEAAVMRQAPGLVPDIRTGQGFDVHRFKPGDHVWICGVRIPHTHGVDAHSDGDVGLHALTDALLGAISDGDIGEHFKNSDPRWSGCASSVFLADAARRVAALGGRIGNVDVTMLCEAPRVGPYRYEMRNRIAQILAIEPGRVGIKATTTEGLGFAGRREGLAAMAIATVILPPSR